MNVNASAHLHQDHEIKITRCIDGGFALQFNSTENGSTFVSVFGATRDLLLLRDAITEYLVWEVAREKAENGKEKSALGMI